ncbi:alpha/beta hydrolase [Aquibacillus albus]|uniref:Acetyl esterase/lipase n=1 Tax=Aquibacillus albus TaxID=1168171 RepID=A0ABS2MXG3_9BACI|nr:alpha/beta hydrolase [Aquibacillus albus]MBM7570567.1 acetyl esterase/lipase [Aquibacillus albus]
MNYSEILDALAKQNNLMEEEGANIIFKRSPELNKGELDPLVLAEKRKEESEDNPFDVPQDDLLDPAKLAIELRKRMGSPNIDLSTNIMESDDAFENEGSTINFHIYKPEDQKDHLLPAFVFFHGGGFFGGTPGVVANACKGIAEKTPAVVINVDYRLAPEYPAPAAIHDAYEAVKWVSRNTSKLGIDPTKIIVGGDSAGGNLAIAASKLDREKGSNLIGMQALLYPAVCIDPEKSVDFAWPAETYHPHPTFKPKLQESLVGFSGSMYLIKDVYVKDEDPSDPIFSPIFEAELSQMPATFLAIAEFDYLRPSEEKYAAKLREAEVPVTSICYEGMEHAFIDKYGIYPQAEDCVNEIVKMIHSVFELAN